MVRLKSRFPSPTAHFLLIFNYFHLLTSAYIYFPPFSLIFPISLVFDRLYLFLTVFTQIWELPLIFTFFYYIIFDYFHSFSAIFDHFWSLFNILAHISSPLTITTHFWLPLLNFYHFRQVTVKTWFVGRCFAWQYEAYLFSAIYTFVYI